MKKLIIAIVAIAAVTALSLSMSDSVNAEIGDKDFEQAMQKYLKTREGQKAVGEAMQAYVQAMQAEAEQKAEKARTGTLDKIYAEKDNFVKGPANAKVTIVEFSEYACPFCARGSKTMTQVLKAYPKDVKLIFKHAPLPMHKNAESASVASIAAGQQGKFWEMHDALFSNQKGFSNNVKPGDAKAFYIAEAEKLGLDIAKFKKDLDSAEFKKQVKRDNSQGRILGVRGTPGFFINSKNVRGARPFGDFKKIIDEILAAK